MIPNSRFVSQTRYRPHWAQRLELTPGLPSEMKFWLRGMPTRRSAWVNCARADWLMAWLQVEAPPAELEKVRADVDAARAAGVPEAELAELVRVLWKAPPRSRPTRKPRR